MQDLSKSVWLKEGINPSLHITIQLPFMFLQVPLAWLYDELVHSLISKSIRIKGVFRVSIQCGY